MPDSPRTTSPPRWLPLLRVIGWRLLQAIPTLLAISVLTFTIIRSAPGDPFATDKAVREEVRAQLKEHFGFDRPKHEQYLRWLYHAVFELDLGPSTKQTGFTVNEIIAQHFPVSLELGLYSLLIALLIGIPTGVIAAVKRNTVIDYGAMTLAMLGICLPTFVLGPLLLLLFSIGLGWFNPLGWEEPSDRVLPCLTMGLFYAAYVARLARGGMLDILNQDFVRTALAKGLPPLQLVWKHTLKGGLLPVVNFLGPAFARIISGSFVIETIFFIPGLGRFFVTSAFNRDYNVIMGTVLFYAVLLIMLNLVADIIQVLLNPRLRFDS